MVGAARTELRHQTAVSTAFHEVPPPAFLLVKVGGTGVEALCVDVKPGEHSVAGADLGQPIHIPLLGENLPVTKLRACSKGSIDDNSDLSTSWSSERGMDESMSECSLLVDVSSTVPKGIQTLMVRHIPKKYTPAMLQALWPPQGNYDFLFLPYNQKQRRYSSYAFINFVDTAAAEDFAHRWNGQVLPYADADGFVKSLDICVAQHQGLVANVCEHRHVIDKSEKHHPAIFDGTRRVNFTTFVRGLGIESI